MMIRLCSVPLLCLAVLLAVGCGKDSSKGGSGTPTIKDTLPDDKKPKKVEPSTGGGTQKDKGPTGPAPKPD